MLLPAGSPVVLGDQPPYILLGQLSSGAGPSPCAPGEVNWWASLLDPGHQRWLRTELRKLGHRY